MAMSNLCTAPMYLSLELCHTHDAITCSLATCFKRTLSVSQHFMSSLFDILKPRYHEAVYRLKNSLIALVALFTLTHLLPLPTPYASAWNFYRDSFQSSWEKTLAIFGATSTV